MAGGFLGASDKIGRQLWQPIREDSILPVFAANKLLVSSQRQKLLKEIKQLSAVPDEHFTALYQQLIENFAEFVQILPVNNDARICSLLDEGLLRGLHALQLQRSESDEKVKYIMAYVFFSAILLFDVGHALENRTISISSRTGDFIREWLPFEGAMQPSDGYYRVWRRGGYPSWVCRRIAIPLARQLMPEIGFNWIAKDPYALHIWLALLSDDKDAMGELGLIFTQVMAWLKEFRTDQGYIIPINIEPIETKEGILLVKFLKWLEKEAALSINQSDSKLHLIKDGAMLTSDAFKKFVQDTDLDLQESDVLNALSKLGVKWERTRYQYLRGEKPDSRLMAKTAALFGGFHKPASQNIEAQKTFIEGKPTQDGFMIRYSGYSKVIEYSLQQGAPLASPDNFLVISPFAVESDDLPKINLPQQQAAAVQSTAGR